MKYIDPVNTRTNGLKATLSAMVGQPEFEDELREAVVAMADWIEPGVIDDIFVNWIELTRRQWINKKTIIVTSTRRAL